MRFTRLAEGSVDNGPLLRELDPLMERKRQSGEQDVLTPPPPAAAFMESPWRRLCEKPPPPPREQQTADLDAVFRTAPTAARPGSSTLSA